MALPLDGGGLGGGERSLTKGGLDGAEPNSSIPQSQWPNPQPCPSPIEGEGFDIRETDDGRRIGPRQRALDRGGRQPAGRGDPPAPVDPRGTGTGAALPQDQPQDPKGPRGPAAGDPRRDLDHGPDGDPARLGQRPHRAVA